jgi:hypothetical protein
MPASEVHSGIDLSALPPGCVELYFGEMSPKRPTLTDRVAQMESDIAALGISHPRKRRPWSPAEKLGAAGVVVAVVGIAIAYFSWRQPQWKQQDDSALSQKVDDRVAMQFKDRHFDQLVADVNTMKGQMQEISGYLKIIAQNQMKRTAALSSHEFESALAETRAALSVAKKQNVALSSNITEAIQQRLERADHSQPDFWPAAAALINYRSVEPDGSQPNCTDTHMKTTLAKSMSSTDTNVTLSRPFGYENCRIVLDDPKSQAVYMMQLAQVVTLEFRNATIIYHGGPLVFPAFGNGPVLRLLFQNCRFVISPDGPPPQNGKTLIEALLQSKDLDKVTVSLLRG